MSEKKRKRKMSKRSKTSGVSSSGDRSSRPRRRERVVRQPEPIPKLEHDEPVFHLGYMGLQNLDESAQERWRNLVQPRRLIKSTRFCDLQTLRSIGENLNAKSRLRRILIKECTNLCKNYFRILSHYEKRKIQ